MLTSRHLFLELFGVELLKKNEPSSRVRGLWVRVRKWQRLFTSRRAGQKKASAVILMYHSINDPENPAIVSFNIVSPHNFARQMRCLAQRYRVVSLATVVEELRSGQLPLGRTVVLTFDDGYKDNFTHAFPILWQYGLTGTFFLPTGYIGNNKSKWEDSLSFLLATTTSSEIEIQIGDQKTLLPLKNSSDRRETLSILLRRLRLLDAGERERALSQLMTRYGTGSQSPGDIMLSWDDVKVMARDGMSFGAHTVSHVSLATVDQDQAVQEIMRSKRAIENHTGQPVTCFSYPFGKFEDFSPITCAILQSAGFICAATTESGSNAPGSDLFALKRIAIENADSLLDWEIGILSG